MKAWSKSILSDKKGKKKNLQYTSPPPSMAAYSVVHSLQTNTHTILFNSNSPKRSSRTRLPISRRNHLPFRPSGGSKESRDDDEGEKKQSKRWWELAKLYSEVEKLGSGLKDSLSPKSKGDWKDVALMSLSFAVYVYISQKIVCAYCAWVSMLNHS